MAFNLDLSKQAQEIVFSRNTVKKSHPSITFHTVSVAHTSCQKYLSLYLDGNLSSYSHINVKTLKAYKGIGNNIKLSSILSINSILTIKNWTLFLRFRRWFRQLCVFFEINPNGKPEYLLKLIPTGQYSYNTQI